MSSRPLVSHDGSIEKLIGDGYPIEKYNEFLVLNLFYLDCTGALQQAQLVDPINSIPPDLIGPPSNHQLYFTGSQPHNLNGSPMVALGGGPHNVTLGNDLVCNYLFSVKHLTPEGVHRSYSDLYEKFRLYVTMISGPALEKHPGISVGPYRPITSHVTESPFCLPDEMFTHAEIETLNKVLLKQRVAVIGAGGTGGYVVDFLAKCPVKSITILDDDIVKTKNAFRWPGITTTSDIGKTKVEVLVSRYNKFHKNVSGIQERVGIDSRELFTDIDFAFLCIDNANSRKEISNLLASLRIPFIDTGLGLDILDGSLAGMARVTFVSEKTSKSVFGETVLPVEDAPAGIYDRNIQIAEFNALNASLAVIRFKQHLGFYRDDRPYYNLIHTIHRHKVFTQEIAGLDGG